MSKQSPTSGRKVITAPAILDTGVLVATIAIQGNFSISASQTGWTREWQSQGIGHDCCDVLAERLDRLEA